MAQQIETPRFQKSPLTGDTGAGRFPGNSFVLTGPGVCASGLFCWSGAGDRTPGHALRDRPRRHLTPAWVLVFRSRPSDPHADLRWSDCGAVALPLILALEALNPQIRGAGAMDCLGLPAKGRGIHRASRRKCAEGSVKPALFRRSFCLTADCRDVPAHLRADRGCNARVCFATFDPAVIAGTQLVLAAVGLVAPAGFAVDHARRNAACRF